MEKVSLREPILATIIYYDILDYPLTIDEIGYCLINPFRFRQIKLGLGQIPVESVAKESEMLEKAGIIEKKNGLYFLAGRQEICEVRTHRNAVAGKKWKKFAGIVMWLTATPYLRGVFSSGSMALGNTVEDSDFDILIIAKNGRLYTCRFFLWLVSSLMGKRRKRFEKKAPDKLCFNHYITDQNLCLNHESLYNAQTYIHLKPVWSVPGLISRFYAENVWLNKYVYNFSPRLELPPGVYKRHALFFFLAGFGEFILDSSLGDKLESFLKKIQQKKINENPVTYESGGRVVFNDVELEFHPRSFEKFMLNQCNRMFKKYGIMTLAEEKDSGLIK